MDIRAASENRPSRPWPQTAILTAGLVLALSLLSVSAPAGTGRQTGRFSGSVVDLPVTVQTDEGRQTTLTDVSLVLGIGEHETRNVVLHEVDLSAPGVRTGKGDTGTMTGALKASATAPLNADGRFTLALALALHYPLVDRIFPPSPETYLETFGGKLTGALTYNPALAGYRFDGTLHLTVKGAGTGKVLSVDLPLNGVALQPV